jgi:hypothetical protein
LPLLSELTVTGDDAPDACSVVPPSLDVQVAVKPVIGSPPLPFAVNATTAEFWPRVTPVSDGASGVTAATKDADATDAGLVPNVFVTVAVQV